MKALYSLARSKWSASFEFFHWLVMVKAQGATQIVFDTSRMDTRKFDREEIMRRFHSIVEPGPALAGLSHRIGNVRADVESIGSLYDWYNSGNRFERLKTVKPPVKCDYTVTIREHGVKPKGRDSDIEAWSRFAEDIGAVLIHDYYRQPIHLHDRVALYAGAKMNYGVCNGPIALLSLSEYPMTIVVNSERARASVGYLPEHGKLPWMLDNQHMVWREDTYDNLRWMFDGRG